MGAPRMNKLIALLVVAGLAVLAGPTLLNASHPVVKAAPVSGDLPEPTPTTSREAFPETTGLRLTSTVPTVTSTTTIPVALPTTVVPVDTQEVRFPVTQVLPYETPRWKVDYRLDGTQHLSLVITLMPLTNRADQVAERRAQLVAAKAEALAWLLERGGTKSTTYPIVWFPAEAATL